MITRTYKIPEGSESRVDEMVAVAVERFYRTQMQTPVEEKAEYKTAVDTFRKDNKMATRFEVKEIADEVVVKDIIEEEITKE